METTAQFDLNKAIRLWRDNLASSPAIIHEAANELEMHLRDSIAGLEAKGLSPAEAFWVARNRLGSPESLQEEFGKANVERIWIDRLLWMLTGSIVLRLFSSLTEVFTSLATTGLYALAKQPVLPGIFSLLLRFALPALLVVLFWRAGRHSNGWVWHLGRSLKKTPIKTAIVMAVLISVSSAATLGTAMLSAYTMPPESHIALLYWKWPTGVISGIVVPILLGWLLTRSSRRESIE